MALNLDTLGLSATVTAQGISAPDYQTILDTLTSYFRQIYGSDAYLEPDSKDGQMAALVALAVHDANNTAIEIYNSFSPTTAQAAALTDKADKYYRFIYLPSGDTPATLGDGGQDEYTGFAQIDVCSKVALGFKAHSDMIHAARSAYSYSHPLTYGQTTVMVSSVTASPVPVDDDQYSRTALTIYYSVS